MKLLEDAPRYFFLTGKGGVGKTSVACATALHLARSGKRVLLVSTDPASNVGQVFGITIGNQITPVPAVPGLDALEIDPEQAAEAYREAILGPVRAVLPEQALISITEQLSGSCTTEVASFNEFTGLLADVDSANPGPAADYDHVIFDTAPTGHTIRLLSLPGDWTEYLDDGTGDASCLGPMSGLEKQRSVYRNALETLADATQTRLVLVTRPQRATFLEAARTLEELDAIGVRATRLVVNGILPRSSDELSRGIEEREQAVIAEFLPALAQRLAVDLLPLRAVNMRGLAALEALFDPAAPVLDADQPVGIAGDYPPLRVLVDELETQGNGLVMFMGKGGVGKTTIAAAVATELAARGHDVHLTTTDPAAHLVATVGESVPGLQVSSIDPEQATQAYREKIMASKGKSLDDAGRAALAEDLRSPCTEEIAVFEQFSRAVGEARRRFVIMDTAPTGHTLLLMDATGSYHRDIARHMTGSFITPLMRLQDPAHTKVVVVTLAEDTPVLEAELLQQDLERADIHPWAWVVNNSLVAARPQDPLLLARAASEVDQLHRVEQLSRRMAVVPTMGEEPVGVAGVRALVGEAALVG